MKPYHLLLSLALLCACRTSKNKVLPADTPALTYLNQKIQSWVDNGYYNGAAIKIVKDNTPFFESYYGGYSDTTALHVASAGKWVAAATIAAIVDEGMLSLDDPVNKYLPEFNDTKGEATLRQLLSHTAGYPDYQPEGGLAMQVAGRMAELATGKDWEILFQEKIARPLHMNYSLFVPVSQEPGFNPMLGGGFKTCLRDFMNFLALFANRGEFEGKQILSMKAIEEIMSDQVKDAIYTRSEYVANTRQNFHHGIYGLGLWREEESADGKATLISSPGWAGAYPWVDFTNRVYGCHIAKVNEQKAIDEGFSSFYASPVIPELVRDAIKQQNYPQGLKKGMVDIDNNTQLYYEEMGEGEPVIFIHGHSLNHSMWNGQFYEFARQYRAIRYDIRGYGYSSPQTETEQFTHVDDVAKLMDALGIEKAHIVGLSLGGFIGADMLGWYPNRILSAVLASGNVRPLPKPSVPMDEKEATRRDEEIAGLKRKGIDVMKREWFNGLMRSGGTQKERMRKPLWNMIYQWDAWQPLHKEVRVIAGGDAYDRLKINRPDIPVMILEARSEHNRFSANPRILEYLPNGRLEIIEDAGHMVNMERPEGFNGVVISFLEEVDSIRKKGVLKE